MAAEFLVDVDEFRAILDRVERGKSELVLARVDGGGDR